MFPISMLRLGGKNSYIFKYLKSTFQLPKIKGPIQVLASALKNI